MHSDLGQIALRDGSRARCVCIAGPDEAWRERVERVHEHKGGIWRRQVRAMLARPTGAEGFFYQLYREGDGLAFANIMTIESGGVGVLGHVFTRPELRGLGAATLLMGRLLSHFRGRGGRALYLSTGYASRAFRIYESNGFRGVEPGSGVMRFTTSPPPEFEAGYFAPGEVKLEPLNWAGWATASALFAGGFPGLVRNASLKLLGRCLTEEALLAPVEEEELRAREGLAPRTWIARKENGAVVGLASWREDPLWPGVRVADAYCHPDFWHHAPEMLSRLDSGGERLVAYADAGHEEKARALESAGFAKVATLPGWVAESTAGSGRRAVEAWSK